MAAENTKKKTKPSKAKTTSKKSKSNEEIYRVKGKDLLEKTKKLINEGNAKEIIIKDKDDKTIVIIPLTIGIVGAVLVPPIAVIGAIAALVTECTIVVKRR